MQKQSELAEGWSSIFLEDFINIAARIGWKGLKRAEYTDSGPLMLAVKDILINGNIDYEGISEHLSDFRYDESPEIKLKENDILVTKDGTIGKIGFVDNLDCKVTVNSSILVVRPSPAIDSRYLFYYFRSPFFQKIVQMKITGSAVPHIFQKDIKKFQVLIPPLAEQRRIVSAIEALFARLDAANERLDRVPEILKKFRQSVLAAACDGRLTEEWRKEHPDVENLTEYLQEINKIREGCSKKDKLKFKTLSELNVSNLLELPDSWLWIPSNLIFSYVTSGSRGWAKYYSDTGPMFIRIGNLDRNSIYLNFENVQRVSPPDNSEGRRTRIQQNDILISITADIGSIGYICEDIGDAYINQHIALARPVKNLNHKYIAFFLHSQTGGIKQFEKKHRGAIKIGLGLDDIRSIAIPLPPLPEQHEIVRRVDALFALADSIEAKVAAARERTEKLRESILAKAFSGELVETEAELARREGRDYEPADVLLERIKAEQGMSGKKGKAAK